MIPAGIALHSRLAGALEDRARRDLALAPGILANWFKAINDAFMMYAKEFAHEPSLARSLATADRTAIDRIANERRPTVPAGIPVVVGPDGELWTGPLSDSVSVSETRLGRMPVNLLGDSTGVHTLALAPVEWNGRWVGAAGFAIPLTDDAARTLASLTRSEVIIVAGATRRAVASTLDSAMTRAIVDAITARNRGASDSNETIAGRERVAIVTAPLGSGGEAVFARVMGRELAILPELRRIALLSAGGALLLALVLGALLANQVARPVRELAQSARALAEGDFSAPLPHSKLEEVATVSETFAAMRSALSARLADLQQANRELEDRAVRLVSLQSDMLQRERLAASAQLIGHLAHEIRNPVATLRNLLEVIQRHVSDDPEAREYAALAIDELLRMHELAERMLDLNRPRDPALQIARVGQVARDVARLVSAGDGAGNGTSALISIADDANAIAAIAPDALKQVLLNLVQNAREAIHHARPAVQPRIDITVSRDGDTVVVRVTDNGPGIDVAALPRIFDPFFTTKESVQGVGLGLFVAEGMVRTAGGRLTAVNRANGGAEFRIELPATDAVEQPAASTQPLDAR
ncbi:MAG: sensor histidine kinase [Gemmatimonadaceae bacterium]